MSDSNFPKGDKIPKSRKYFISNFKTVQNLSKLCGLMWAYTCSSVRFYEFSKRTKNHCAAICGKPMDKPRAPRRHRGGPSVLLMDFGSMGHEFLRHASFMGQGFQMGHAFSRSSDFLTIDMSIAIFRSSGRY